MFKYTSRKPVQAIFRQGEQSARNASAPSIQELGALLRERREAMGASLAEVETATRIRQKYLAALESDEWDLLPGEVIGRGFLRNYATYLGLDPTEVIERRRAVADPSLAGALSNISAGAPLPPMREVDYRPKDVAIRDEPEAIEQREIRLGPIFTVLGLLALLLFVGWGLTHYGDQVSAGFGSLVEGVQTSIAYAPTATATRTPTPQATPAQVGAQDQGTPVMKQSDNSSNNVVGPTKEATRRIEIILVPTDTPASTAITNTTTSTDITNTTQAAAPTPVPTDTPAPTTAPTNTPAPTEGPTETPTETPTVTPAPVIAAAACADQRSVISSPGVNQVVSGAVPIAGRAVHENFDRYKLEFAPGANAGGGFTFFAGDANQIDGGVLGTLNTASLPNGAYTIQLTVIDKTGNYPPPCQVSVVVQN